MGAMQTHRNERKTMTGSCEQRLKCYRDEEDDFLFNIVMGDETWVHHYNPERNSRARNTGVHHNQRNSKHTYVTN